MFDTLILECHTLICANLYFYSFEKQFIAANQQTIVSTMHNPMSLSYVQRSRASLSETAALYL